MANTRTYQKSKFKRNQVHHFDKSTYSNHFKASTKKLYLFSARISSLIKIENNPTTTNT